MQAVEAVAPFAHLLEVGGHCGPNIRRLSARWPGATYTVLDANEAALTYGAKKRAAGAFAAPVAFRSTASFGAEEFPTIQPTADVVLSCYALAYAEPAQLMRAIAAAAEAGALAFVLAEPHGAGALVSSGAEPGFVPEWHHDYAALLRALWPGCVLGHFPVQPPADRLNAITVAMNR